MLMRDGTNTKLQTRGGCIFKQKEARSPEETIYKVCATNTCEFKKNTNKKTTKISRINEIM